MKKDEFVEKTTDAIMDKMKESFEVFFKESPFAGQHKTTYSQSDVKTAMLGAYLAGGTMVFQIIKVIDAAHESKTKA